MILTVAKKEFLFSITTLRFSVLVLICCLLMPISVWVLSSDYLRELEDYRGRVELEEGRQAGKDASINVSRPVPQLSALFRGVSLESVNNVDLKFLIGWNRPNAAESQSDTHAVFPTVDLSFIIGVVFSALSLMLSYDALCGEKEQATLSLMMSSPVSRSSIVVGKWLGLTLTMILPFLLGILLSLLLLFSTTGVVLSGANWIALTLALLVCLVFLSSFVLLGITISALTGSTARSIISCLVTWSLLTMIVPQLANVASENLVPIPSTQAKEKNIRLAHNEFCRIMRNSNIELSKRARREGWEYSRVIQLQEEIVNRSSLDGMRAMNAIEEEYRMQVAEQENVGKLISALSPYGSLNLAMIALADTGPESQRAFLTAAYRYGEFYFEELANDKSGRSTEEVISEIPKFDFRETSLEQRLSLAALPAALLVFTNILLIFVAVIAFNRYDVR